MIGHDFGIGVLPAANRVHDITFCQDSDAPIVLVYYDSCADPALGHHPRRLPQRMGRADTQDDLCHPVLDFHAHLPSPSLARPLCPVGFAPSATAGCLCVCDLVSQHPSAFPAEQAPKSSTNATNNSFGIGIQDCG